MKKLLSLGIISLFLIGCGSGIKYNYSPEIKNISFPRLNTVVKSYVGDEMIRQGYEAKREVITFPNKVEISQLVSYYVPAGDYPKLGESDKYNYYSLIEANTSIPVQKSTFADLADAIIIYKDEKNKDICVITVYGSKVCEGNLYYEINKKNFINQKSLQQVLVYNGKVGNKINIGYREFEGGYARPAFSNNVEYDLSESQVLRYSGAEIRVIKATNQYIEYEVLKNFNTK